MGGEGVKRVVGIHCSFNLFSNNYLIEGLFGILDIFLGDPWVRVLIGCF